MPMARTSIIVCLSPGTALTVVVTRAIDVSIQVAGGSIVVLLVAILVIVTTEMASATCFARARPVVAITCEHIMVILLAIIGAMSSATEVESSACASVA